MYRRLMIATVLATLVGLMSACDKDGPAENAGEELDNMAEDIGNNVEDACEDVKENLQADNSNC